MITVTAEYKIAEIKHIRAYCYERYGVHSRLQETKNLIERVIHDQSESRKTLVYKAELQQKLNGLRKQYLDLLGYQEVNEIFVSFVN